MSELAVSSSSPRVKPFATNGGLVKQLRRGVPGLRAVRAVFRERSPDDAHLRSLVFQGVDPDLLAVMLGRQLAGDWVPRLWRLYNELRVANGPAFREDVFAGWQKVRAEWVPLWTQLRERLAAVVAAGGVRSPASNARGRSRAGADRSPPVRPGRAGASPAPAPSSSRSGRAPAGSSSARAGSAVRRPPRGAVDPALAAALEAAGGAGPGLELRSEADASLGVDRPVHPHPRDAAAAAAAPGSMRLRPPAPAPPNPVVSVPVPPAPLPDYRAIAGASPALIPLYLFQLLTAMRSNAADVARLRDQWVALGGSPDTWDQWMWPSVPLADWCAPPTGEKQR